jgi:hypothetical protein
MCENCSHTFIFTGPSLHPDEARPLIDATILPPIQRGDLKRLAAERPRAVGIIDGEFYQRLAVSPKEILPLLERGVTIYGASSMGALRAVELARFGMVGIGRVFRLFRAGFLDADDEVALAFDPTTYRAASEPLVNTRYALRAAVRDGIVDRAEAVSMLEKLKAAYFPDRTRSLLYRLALQRIGDERGSRLKQFLESNARNVKNEDARMMIEAMKRTANS